MRTTVNLLDAVKSRHGFTSDYQLAKRLGVSLARMSNWRREQNSMSEDVAVRVAELLEEDPGKVLLEVYHERAKCTEVRSALRRLLSGAAHAAIVGGISGLLLLGGSGNSLWVKAKVSPSAPSNIHYAKLLPPRRPRDPRRDKSRARRREADLNLPA